LPAVDCPAIASAADALLASLVEVAKSRRIAVEFKPIAGGAFGVSLGGSIIVDPSHSSGQQAKTLAHELAHEALHQKANRVPGFSITRNLAELEAESVAYVVCRHFGLECDLRCTRYIALWDGNGAAVRQSMRRIADTAKSIIDAIESPAESATTGGAESAAADRSADETSADAGGADSAARIAADCVPSLFSEGGAL